MRKRTKDWISLVEAGYNLAGNDQQWLDKLREKADPLLGRGLWPTMMTYRYSPTSVVIEQTATNGPAKLVQWAQESTCQKKLSVDLMYRSSIPVGSLSEVVYSRMPEVRHIPRRVSLGAMSDALAVKAHCGSGRAILLWSGFTRLTSATAGERRRWPAVISHLAAGLRMRSLAKHVNLNALDQGKNPVEAIIDSNGKLLHVSDQIAGNDSRASLREAARVIERIRRGRDRDEPERTMPLWQGLVEGRWSLVDRFDSDGKRFIVAIRNDPEHTDPRGLSLRERQIAEYVGIGYGNKAIAYTLGISLSTVSNSIACVLFKLGLQRRVELAAFFAPGGLRARLSEVALGGEEWLMGTYPLAGKISTDKLTDSERCVMAHLVLGSTNDDIAHRRNTSARTVANQVQSIFRKLNVRSRTELVAQLHCAA